MATLVYSRKRHCRIFDHRVMGIDALGNPSIYIPSIEPIVRAMFQEEINEAKKRVVIDRGGYKYTPSSQYLRFLNKKTK